MCIFMRQKTVKYSFNLGLYAKLCNFLFNLKITNNESVQTANIYILLLFQQIKTEINYIRNK